MGNVDWYIYGLSEEMKAKLPRKVLTLTQFKTNFKSSENLTYQVSQKQIEEHTANEKAKKRGCSIDARSINLTP